MKITVKNKIYLEGLEPIIEKYIKKVLTLDNPAYFVMKAMGKYPPPKQFTYWEQIDNKFVIPRGMIGRVKRYFDKEEIDYQLNKTNVSVLFNGKLRDYQQTLIDSIQKDEGIIHAGTGVGKTICGIALIAKYGLATTIIVPTKNIMTQWVDECKKHLDYDVGIVGNGDKTIKNITVATWQSLKGRALDELVRKSGMILVDECQGTITKKRLRVLASFNPTRLYGLSATLARGDKQDVALGFFFGPVVAKYAKTLLTPHVKQVNTRVDIPVLSKYNMMIDNMIQNEYRNKLIVSFILDEMLNKRKILVLTKRIEHYNKIREILPKRDDIYTIDSKDKDSLSLLTLMKNNLIDYSVVLGTVNMLGVGVDIPSLDTLVIAGDVKSSILTEQSVGRILRAMENKIEPLVIDFCDFKNRILRRQGMERKSLYNKKGWPVDNFN